MRLVKHPVLCNYYLTYRCNAKCGFCDIWERPSPYITLENAAANFKDLKKLGVKVIDFTGGEPLLHRQLDSLLRMAKEIGFITTVTTNCLLYPKYANKLQGLVDMLHFSVDSAYADTHNASRGVACYHSVLESIHIARSLNEQPDILFTVTQDNIGEIEEVSQRFCQADNLVLILNPVFEYNSVDTGGQLNNGHLKTLENWGKQPGVYINRGFIGLRRDGGNQISKPVCRAASTTLVISPANKLILPCYHLGAKEFAIEDELVNLYNSAEVQALIKLEGRLPACQGCTINCYMQPSFAVETSKYFWQALPSTLKYNKLKGTWKQLFA